MKTILNEISNEYELQFAMMNIKTNFEKSYNKFQLEYDLYVMSDSNLGLIDVEQRVLNLIDDIKEFKEYTEKLVEYDKELLDLFKTSLETYKLCQILLKKIRKKLKN